MTWFIPIKMIDGKEIYLKLLFSVQKGDVKCTVAPIKAYKPPNFCFEFWSSCECRMFKDTVEK